MVSYRFRNHPTQRPGKGPICSWLRSAAVNGCTARSHFVDRIRLHPPAGPVRTPFVVAFGRQRTGSSAMIIKSILAASAALIITASAASAAEVAALTGDNTIAIVDTSQKKVVKTWNITGIAGKVLGIDVRPADGMLYALGADGGVYTVDRKTGKATMKSKLETMLPAGVMATVDFNPVGRPPARDGQRRHQPARQRRRRQGHQGRQPQVRRRRHAQGREAECGRRRLHQFGEGHQGDDALQHRRHDRRAGHAGAAERRRAQCDRQARRSRPTATPSTSGRTARARTKPG